MLANEKANNCDNGKFSKSNSDFLLFSYFINKQYNYFDINQNNKDDSINSDIHTNHLFFKLFINKTQDHNNILNIIKASQDEIYNNEENTKTKINHHTDSINYSNYSDSIKTSNNDFILLLIFILPSMASNLYLYYFYLYAKNSNDEFSNEKKYLDKVFNKETITFISQILVGLNANCLYFLHSTEVIIFACMNIVILTTILSVDRVLYRSYYLWYDAFGVNPYF